MEKIAKARAGACDPMPRELASQLTVRRQPGSRCDERDGDASSGAETCMYLATVALASHRSADARKGLGPSKPVALPAHIWWGDLPRPRTRGEVLSVGMCSCCGHVIAASGPELACSCRGYAIAAAAARSQSFAAAAVGTHRSCSLSCAASARSSVHRAHGSVHSAGWGCACRKMRACELRLRIAVRRLRRA